MAKQISRGGERLRTWLFKHRLSQEELGQRVGVDGSLICGLVTGRIRCSLAVALRISNETGLPVKLYASPKDWRTLKLYVDRQRSTGDFLRENENVA